MPSIFSNRITAAVMIALLLCISIPVVAVAEEVSPEPQSVTETEVESTPTQGASGSSGTEGEAGDVVPVEVVNAVGTNEGADGETPEEHPSTGGVSEHDADSVSIVTGDATATGDIATNANNNNVQSQITGTTTSDDLDTYTFSATGTNEALVHNLGTTTSTTGANHAVSEYGLAHIDTGDAVSVLNIANIVNSNVVNSAGLITLLNVLLEAGESLDMRELFFPDPAATEARSCSLISCYAEDIQYIIEHTNLAEIVNDANLAAISGANTASGTAAVITTGDAYGSANVLNVANTNIIDSNYLLVALNALGNLDGNLILPTAELWNAFFAKPNGLNQLEDIEDFVLNDENSNEALVNNALLTNAEAGANHATSTDATLTTGDANADSNIVNEINKNLIGGDSMYVMIRIHGAWNGNLHGLPEGLAWTRLPEGVLIYNEGEEIVPSQIVALDVDSYTADLANANDVTIDNNITIDARSGDNAIEGTLGVIATGDAYAGANVMNIANTNVIGRNWVVATMNIFGDLVGDISFGQPDLWIGGKVSSPDSPVKPGSRLIYTYTIKNNGDLKATNVEFIQELADAYTYSGGDGTTKRTERRESLGTIRPGEQIEVTYEAYVQDELPYGTTNVSATARLLSDEPEQNAADNSEILTMVAERSAPSSSGGSSGGSPSSSSGGRVLGARVNRATDEKRISSDAIPKLSITKSADYDDDARIQAGTVVNYSIRVRNQGGKAYDARVIDTLANPIGTVMNEQAWDLGDIEAGEEIELTYEIMYDQNTPSGTYENTAKLIAYRHDNDPSSELAVATSTHELIIDGVDLAIGNVRVIGVFPTGNAMSAAVISWETSKPTDGQIFLSEQGVVSPYDPLALNYGYERASIRLPFFTTRHYMFIPNLMQSKTYTYRIRSSNGTSTAFGGDYAIAVTTPAPLSATSTASFQ